jgi:hypothetical protein
MPVGLERAASTSTWPMGVAGAETGPATTLTRVAPASVIEPQAWHSGH